MPTALDPWRDGQPPHVPWLSEHGPLPRVALLPGDPFRVPLYSQVLDEFRQLGQRREYSLAVGSFRGSPLAVCSTGIGGPSTEIALVELKRLGVEIVIRTGGMGSISALPAGAVVPVGSVVTSGSGTARDYGASEIVDADPQVLEAIRGALPAQDQHREPILVYSADSYYVGEGRPVGGLEGLAERRLAEISESGAVGIDMEAATVLAVGQAVGLRCGAVLVAHGNRVDDGWITDYEPYQLAMMRAGAAAASELSRTLTGGAPA